MTAGSLLGSFSLPVSIQTSDGLSWSDDGKLAVVTKKGVYVFEVTPDARGPGGPKTRNTKNECTQTGEIKALRLRLKAMARR